METKTVINEIFAALPHIKKVGTKHLWFDFDEGADVLYISVTTQESSIKRLYFSFFNLLMRFFISLIAPFRMTYTFCHSEAKRRISLFRQDSHS